MLFVPADCCHTQRHAATADGGRVARAAGGRVARAASDAAAAATAAVVAEAAAAAGADSVAIASAFCHWDRSAASQGQAQTSRPNWNLVTGLVPRMVLRKKPKSLLQHLGGGNEGCCCLHGT